MTPAKSVSAALIEDSLVSQMRMRLSVPEARTALRLTDGDWQAFLQDPVSLVPALVEGIRYEGTTGTVSVTLRGLSSLAHEVRR